ncbi:uncharacterized protein LOC119559448 isoform X2 [Drosophila subpulchrella]|nr:uncharacterized protein LOC119559448 isoform X2 [Drosophila subpulchrella]XP_037728479.1 uncharacterized protein LOC119559448 isoform X2 [Drosophila subpulchrella]
MSTKISDKDAYEVCCRRIQGKPENLKGQRTPTRIEEHSVSPEKTDHRYAAPTLKAQRSLAPLAQRPVIVRKIMPSWREEHEKKVKANAKAQELEKQNILIQNLNKKRDAMNKFQKNFELNKAQTVRRRRIKDIPYFNPPKAMTPDPRQENKKPSSEYFEHALLKQVSKERLTSKDFKRIKRVHTTFGIYQKREEQAGSKEAQRASEHFGPMFEKTTTVAPGLHSALKSMHKLEASKLPTKSAQHTDLFNEMLKGKAVKYSEFNPLLKSSQRLKVALPKDNTKISKQREGKTTKVGAKFSWGLRKKLRNWQNTGNKSFKDLIKGNDVEMPERISALKSRTRLGSQIKQEGKKAKTKKSQLKKKLEPNFGFRTFETYRHFNITNTRKGPTKLFLEMLKGKETLMPELNRALTSMYRIQDDSKDLKESHSDLNPVLLTKKSVLTKDRTVSETFEKIATAKEPEVLRHFEKILASKVCRLPDIRGVLKRKERSTRARPQKFQSSSSSDFEYFSLKSNRSSRHHLSFSSGKKINLKKFYQYIKNSMPDRKIYYQMNSKNPISYLTSEKSFFYPKTPSLTSSDKSQRTVESVISTTDFAQSMLPKQKREENKGFEAIDTDENLFDTFPEDHDIHDGLKNTMNDIIASIAKVDKAQKKSQPKQEKKKSKPSESTLEATVNRQSILSIKSVGEEVKTRESLALRELDLREQWRQSFLTEERASVQARIQELMEEVAIRKDFRPPKPARDFVTENILTLRNSRPTKKSHLEEKVKPRGKFETLSEVLTVPEDPVNLSRFSEEIYNKYFQEWPEEFASSRMDSLKPVRIRRYSDRLWKGQMGPYQAEIKKSSPEETVCMLTARKKRNCCS